MNPDQLRALLTNVQQGTLAVPEALKQLRTLPYENLGFASLDHHRALRQGFPEVIFCEGKTVAQVVSADLTIDLVSPTGQTVRVFNRSNAGDSQFSGVNFGTCANNNDDGVPGCPATYTVVNTGGSSWDVASSKTTASASCSGYTGPCNGLYYYIAQTYTSANSFCGLNGASLNVE